MKERVSPLVTEITVVSKLPNLLMTGQLYLASLKLVQFLCLDNCAEVYVGAPIITSDNRNPTELTLPPSFEEPDLPSTDLPDLARPSLRTQNEVFKELEKFSNCAHSEYVCTSCADDLLEAATLIQWLNPPLYRYVQELAYTNNVHGHPTLARKLARHALDLLRKHQGEAEIFLENLNNIITAECIDYSEEYKSIFIEDIEEPFEDPLGIHSGIFIPSQPKCRPLLTFSKDDGAICNNNYSASHTFSNAVLTIHCECDKPMVLGYIAMPQAESISLALTAVLSHFKIPPRIICYDNGCNMFQSILIRTPWLLHM